MRTYNLTDESERRRLFQDAEAAGILRTEIEADPAPEPLIVCPRCGSTDKFLRYRVAKELVSVDTRGHLIESHDWELISEHKRVQCLSCRKKFTAQVD